MKKPRICAAIVNADLEAAREIEPLVDMFEVRIDLMIITVTIVAGKLGGMAYFKLRQ